MADRVAILRVGRIEQIGTPEEIYDKPASPFVYDFLGNVNLFQRPGARRTVVIGRTPKSRAGNRRRVDSDAIASCGHTTFASPANRAGRRRLAARVIASHARARCESGTGAARYGGQFTVQLSKEYHHR